MSTPREIGSFEILERLGAGGMGEVFKARDKRLNRFVAIKFLPEAATAQARERFQREAQAIAALNHANICTLHEIGEDNGRPYLVLELLEGENLRARLRRGAVAPEQVLDWGVGIADALDAAHRKGILHRDLKPDNLWVTTGGQIKVLDFGLARLEAEVSDEAPTVDIVLTSPGQTMGTYPYMSPEQARGEALDARSDLFSLGSVLYEMASGRQPFARTSAAETMAAVLKEQPPALEQPAGRLVFTRTLGDKSMLWSEGADGSGARQIAIPLSSGFILQPAVTPDGKVVFSSTDGSTWRTAADGTGLTEVPHTIGGVLVRGGREVIYLNHTSTSQTLWSVPLAGGTPRQVWSNKVFGDGLAASPDGMRLFAFARGATADAHLAVILGLTESPPKITPLKMDFYSMLPPYGWTPDGRAITYIKNVGSVDNIWAFPISGGRPFAITHFTELRIAAYAFSKDGRLAVSRGSDNSDAVLATGLEKKP